MMNFYFFCAQVTTLVNNQSLSGNNKEAFAIRLNNQMREAPGSEKAETSGQVNPGGIDESQLEFEAVQELEQEEFGQDDVEGINMEGAVFHVSDDPSQSDFTFGDDGTIYRIGDGENFTVGQEDNGVFSSDDTGLVFTTDDYQGNEAVEEAVRRQEELEAEMELEGEEGSHFVTQTVNLEYRDSVEKEHQEFVSEVAEQDFVSDSVSLDNYTREDKDQQVFLGEDQQEMTLNYTGNDNEQGGAVSLISLGDGVTFEQPELGDGTVIELGGGADMGQMEMGGGTIFFINNIVTDDED